MDMPTTVIIGNYTLAAKFCWDLPILGSDHLKTGQKIVLKL